MNNEANEVIMEVPENLKRYKDLELSELGLYLLLKSLPENFKISIQGIAKIVATSEYRIARTMNKLIDKKYVERTKVQENGRYSGYVYKIN